MLTFNSRTAVVTGAGRGIGRAIAETLARHGVTVICVSKSAESCGAAAAAITAAGGRAKALAVDVADGAAIAQAAESLLQEFPAIDILVNNAGITRDGLLFRMSEGDWNDVLATNLTSCFHWTKHLARPMTRARWGRIVNIASVSGITGQRGTGELFGGQGGNDRPHQDPGPRVRVPECHGQCRGSGFHPDRHDGRLRRESRDIVENT